MLSTVLAGAFWSEYGRLECTEKCDSGVLTHKVYPSGKEGLLGSQLEAIKAAHLHNVWLHSVHTPKKLNKAELKSNGLTCLAEKISKQDSIRAVARLLLLSLGGWGGGESPNGQDTNNGQFVERKGWNNFNFAAKALPEKRLRLLSPLLCTRTIGRVS